MLEEKAVSSGACRLDLSHFPPIFVLSAHLTDQELQETEDALTDADATLTYDIKEAKLIVGKLFNARRARLELSWKGLKIGRLDNHTRDLGGADAPRKRARLGGSAASLPTELVANEVHDASSNLQDGHVLVLKIEWISDSIRAHTARPVGDYVLCDIAPDNESDALQWSDRTNIGSGPTDSILDRAKLDNANSMGSWSKKVRINEAAQRDFSGRSFASAGDVKRSMTGRAHHGPAPMIRQSTSEFEDAKDVVLPPPPDWVQQGVMYACQRSTPTVSPNEDFISQLKEIRLARLLLQDEIGVRAYSTSIAAIAAYPYRLQSTREVLSLPGCDQKIALLFHEYRTEGSPIQAVRDIQADPALKVLREFFNIWGVGAVTAREFFYDKGWQDLDDVVEYGWTGLNRVQQIGLKYYEEFQLPITREEVEKIASIIETHARRLTNPAIQAIIVGGYRRGKLESGDVDVILSHPEQEVTYDLVSQVVESLEQEGWITHTLTLNLTNTKRNQEPVALKPSGIPGSGFDTLDKALVVWQDPHWPTKDQDLATDPSTKNPNPHRRVDIIISPWRTVGCAVAGWTSGTTFQRDLRRYAKKVKGWKFDSSGVRDRVTGAWIDLEEWQDAETRCSTWQQAEKRVFEGLGLEYREPEERCTG